MAEPAPAPRRSTAPPAALAPGDPVPRIVLPLPQGGQIDFTHQTIAGRTLVLWISSAASDKAATGGFGALGGEFAAREAAVFAVLATSSSGSLDGVPVVLDPESRVRRGFGLGVEAAFIVIGPDSRLAAICAEVGSALAVATALFDRVAHAPVLVIPSVLEPGLCRRLIAYWAQGDQQRDSVSASIGGRSYVDAGTKRRIDVAVTDAALDAELKFRVARRVLPEIQRAFQARLTHMEPFRIGCYDAAEGGYFRRHRDNATRYTAHRQFALTINLNAGEFEGGELRFPEYGRQRFRPDAGGAVVFSSALLHEALPVTMGRRFGVFSFLYDAAGEARVQNIIAEEIAAGRRGLTTATDGIETIQHKEG